VRAKRTLVGRASSRPFGRIASKPQNLTLAIAALLVVGGIGFGTSLHSPLRLSAVAKEFSDPTEKVVGTIPVNNPPLAMAYDSGTRAVYVTERSGPYGSVSWISDSGSTVAGSIPVGVVPGGIAYDNDRG